MRIAVTARNVASASKRQRFQPQQPAAGRMPGGKILFHPLAKKVEISSAGIAPSRMMRQRAPSSVKIDDGRRNIARRGAPIHNDADAPVQLVVHLLGAGALRRAAQIR